MKYIYGFIIISILISIVLFIIAKQTPWPNDEE